MKPSTRPGFSVDTVPVVCASVYNARLKIVPTAPRPANPLRISRRVESTENPGLVEGAAAEAPAAAEEPKTEEKKAE
jgi:hypothetical protein